MEVECPVFIQKVVFHFNVSQISGSTGSLLLLSADHDVLAGLLSLFVNLAQTTILGIAKYIILYVMIYYDTSKHMNVLC